MKHTRLLVVGNPEPIHVGSHLRAAAESMGIPVDLCDTRAAFQAAWLARQWHWRVRGRMPPRLGKFQTRVLQSCEQQSPTHVLATGIAPLTKETLTTLRSRGCIVLNYLTDDPWNPTQGAGWFLNAVPHYDAVFTPRRANMDDLRALGCACVEFLPFAYNPVVHFPDVHAPDEGLESEILFAGGADADRVPYLAALIRAGFDVRLYGGYWDRYGETRAAYCGHADHDLLRRAVKNARVCLNLVRRANRDDNVMRTFEIPAMGGCMLTEDTDTHRTLFGDEGDSVLYFQSMDEMVTKARQLLNAPMERERLADAARTRIVENGHSYQDRLERMFSTRHFKNGPSLRSLTETSRKCG